MGMHHVEIIATPSCGHCRQVTEAVTDAALSATSDVEVHGIDATLHPELARDRYGLLESPIIVVDGFVVARGAAPSAAELKKLLR